VLAVSPIIKKLFGLWEWIFNMATHTGKYGGGAKGLIDTSQLAGHLTALIKAFPFFYLSMLLFAGYLLYTSFLRVINRNKVSSATTEHGKVITVFLVIGVVQTLMVMKHFGQHYMISALPLAFIGSALLLKVFLERTAIGLLIPKGAKWLVALGVVYLVVQSNYMAFATLKRERVAHNRSVSQINAEIAKYPDALTISSYGCYLRQCGLMFGIEYAPAIDKKIKPFLTNFYGFNVWNSMLVIDGHGFYPLSVLEPFLQTNRPIFLITQIDFPAFDVFKKELVLTAADQKLYRILGLNQHK